MLSAAPIAPGAAALAEAKAYLRVVGTDEDAAIARMTAAAAELCERFTGQALLARAFTETLAAGASTGLGRGVWTQLAATPVASIDSVEAIAADMAATPIPPDRYAIDIDACGHGWIRLASSDAVRVRVAYQAGLAADWAALPDALRQGMMRLVAHLFTHRDAAAGASPPASVTALWRPWRRLSAGGPECAGRAYA